MTPVNLNSEWAALLIDTFVQGGVADVVISPGSRSTPLAWAAIRREELRAHRVIDERSAAFFAVGQAKMTGNPTLIICTSGTAGAHYYPAVIEASRSAAPLIVLTADRPGELQGNGAAQTIDQTRLYGNHTRAFIDLGIPEASEIAFRALRGKCERALGMVLFPTPGPVHVNAPFRKPLEPGAADKEDERRVAEIAEALRERPVPAITRSAHDGPGVLSAIDELVRICGEEGMPFITCGPVSPAHAGDRMAMMRQLSALPFPVFAEATSQLRYSREVRDSFCDGFDTFLRSPAMAKRKADAVIRIGSPLTSKGWELYADRVHAPTFIVAPHQWDDPGNSGARFIRCSGEYFVQKFYERFSKLNLTVARREIEWYRNASRLTAAALEEIVPSSDKPLTSASTARTLVSSLPTGSLLALSNSLPVRDVDMYTAGCEANLIVWCQRGVNGIDGLISGAAGASCKFADYDAGTTLYIGDVAFLHDLNGLAAAREATGPFVVVVAGNGGGRIFEQLPIARHPEMDDAALEWWTTPPDVAPEGAAALFGIPFARAETPTALESALKRAHNSTGCTIIEAVIDPASIVAEQERLRNTVLQKL